MPRVPNPRLGYILTALSATCSALNGVLSRYLLDDGMSPTGSRSSARRCPPCC